MQKELTCFLNLLNKELKYRKIEHKKFNKKS